MSKEELQNKINECDQRRNELLVELSRLRKLMIVIEDQLVGEREILIRLKEDLRKHEAMSIT